MNEELQKTSGADVLSSKKTKQKNLRGVPPPPLYVRGLICTDVLRIRIPFNYNL